MEKTCTYCEEEIIETSGICHNCGMRSVTDNIQFENTKTTISNECDNQGSTVPTLLMYEIRLKREIAITHAGIIGRLGDIEQSFFSSDPYVSQYHCKVYFEDGHWLLEHLSETNSTAISGVNLEYNMPMVIRDNDRVRIADLYFKVSIASDCVDNHTTDNIEGASSSVEKPIKNDAWEVICPVCGKIYTGDSDNLHIEECEQCDDEFDKKEISKISPRPQGKCA